MNKAKLKTYAPQARKDFIAAVTARAHRLARVATISVSVIVGMKRFPVIDVLFAIDYA
jgi:hypothetical protein